MALRGLFQVPGALSATPRVSVGQAHGDHASWPCPEGSHHPLNPEPCPGQPPCCPHVTDPCSSRLRLPEPLGVCPLQGQRSWHLSTFLRQQPLHKQRELLLVTRGPKVSAEWPQANPSGLSKIASSLPHPTQGDRVCAVPPGGPTLSCTFWVTSDFKAWSQIWKQRLGGLGSEGNQQPLS